MLYPRGRVDPNYLKFLLSVCSGNFITGITSVLSTHGMFATFVQDETNINLFSMSLNMIGKDIIGQTLSFPLINILSKEPDPQKHLRQSFFIYEVSNFLECLTPLINSNYFIYLASLGNIGKNIGFTNYGAFNAKYINIMSLDKDNISEIYSIVTCTSSISFSLGMLVGLGIVKIIPDHELRLILIPFLGIIRFRLVSTLTKIENFSKN